MKESTDPDDSGGLPQRRRTLIGAMGVTAVAALASEPVDGSANTRGGHDLGNHTSRHQPMRRLSASAAYEEIARGTQAISKTVGQAPRWFRPSGTPHATPTILSAAARAGYQHSISFDVDPADHSDPGAHAVVARTLRAVGSGSIVSLHPGHPGTLTALPATLSGLAKASVTPVGLSMLLPGVNK